MAVAFCPLDNFVFDGKLLIVSVKIIDYIVWTVSLTYVMDTCIVCCNDIKFYSTSLYIHVKDADRQIDKPTPQYEV